MSMIDTSRPDASSGALQLQALRQALCAQPAPPSAMDAFVARLAGALAGPRRSGSAQTYCPTPRPVSTEPLAPAAPRKRARRAATFRDLLELRAFRSSVSFCSLAAALWVTFQVLAPAPSDPQSLEEPHRFWSEVTKPFHLYRLATDEFGELGSYTAKRTRFGGGRRDTLTFGPLDRDEPHLHVSFYRVGDEEATEARFETEVARRAAEAGLVVEKAAGSDQLDSRFGPFDTSDMTLAGPTGRRACLGFHRSVADPGFRVTGFACGSSERPVDRSALACIIDRVDLVGAGEDEALSAFFAATEPQRRADCFRLRNSRVGNWLDPLGETPALRTDGKRK